MNGLWQTRFSLTQSHGFSLTVHETSLTRRSLTQPLATRETYFRSRAALVQTCLSL
jgi:hypothetical protein